MARPHPHPHPNPNQAVTAYHPWAQYSRSKAGACLLARALTSRMAAAGVVGDATSSDPGLAATGVNVQHDLAATLGEP